MSAPTAAPARWVRRDELAKAGLRPGTAKGLLRIDPTGSVAVPLGPTEVPEARALTAETLQAAGVKASDRVVVALNSDGDLGGALIAEAAAEVAAAAVAPGPRGRMRLLKVIEAVRGSVLVITPTGAADFLARLHLEFLVDPLDLELRLLVLTGEVGDERTRAHLAKEFGATVVELWTDPVTTVPVARREGDTLVETRPGTLHLLGAEKDEVTPGEPAEIAVAHPWLAALAGTGVRTGYLVTAPAEGDAVPAPAQTGGDLLLVRGRWLSIAALTKALRGIDGISHWRLDVAREGTLDAATLTVSFNRASLVQNGMWRGRIQQTLATLTPVSIAVEIDPEVRETPQPPVIADARGQHVGTP
ncbi:hypothetical protein ACFQH9_19475 [Pseudonocardia lutea]|uniref:Phenylacetate-CoA ligase n=1 Tax=Pseudonocardia lutea TaxID=2172015 RepID=A0ABW1ICJ3_9PSEU